MTADFRDLELRLFAATLHPEFDDYLAFARTIMTTTITEALNTPAAGTTLVATLANIAGHWTGLGSAERLEQQQALNYIRELAGRCDVSLGRTNLLPVFGTGTGYRLVVDRREINKRFFKKWPIAQRASATVPEVAEARVSVMNAQIQEQLDVLRRTMFDADIKAAEEDAAAFTLEAEAYRRVYEHILRLAALATDKARDLRNRTMPDHPLANVIGSVLAAGRWDHPMLVRGELWFRIKQPVVLVERSRAAGLETVQNMGYFAAVWSIADRRLRVYPAGENLWYSDFYHPHISASAQVCWGNASDAADRAIADSDLLGLLNVLHDVLSTYNAGNPYVELPLFERVQSADQRAIWRNVPDFTTVGARALSRTPEPDGGVVLGDYDNDDRDEENEDDESAHDDDNDEEYDDESGV